MSSLIETAASSMNEHTDTLSRIATGCAYLTSGGLVFADFVHLLNENAGFFGISIAFLTYFTNTFFQWRRYRLLKNKRRGDNDS